MRRDEHAERGENVARIKEWRLIAAMRSNAKTVDAKESALPSLYLWSRCEGADDDP